MTLKKFVLYVATVAAGGAYLIYIQSVKKHLERLVNDPSWDEERKNLYISSGIILERIKRGDYDAFKDDQARQEKTREDAAFERIRLNEESRDKNNASSEK